MLAPEVTALRTGRTLGSRPGADTSWVTPETPCLSGSGRALPSAPTFGGPPSPCTQRPASPGSWGELGRADAKGRLPGARGPRLKLSDCPRPGTAPHHRSRAVRAAPCWPLSAPERSVDGQSRGSEARILVRSKQKRPGEWELSAASRTFSLFLSQNRPLCSFPPFVLAQPWEATQNNFCFNATPAESFYVPCKQCHLGLNVPHFLYPSEPWFPTKDAFAPRGPLAVLGGRPSGGHTWSREAATDI